MSNIAQGWAWKIPVGGVMKLVLIALADHSDDEGICWPGVKGIAEKCGVTQRTVENNTAQLESLGWIRIEKRWRQDHSRTSNYYYLNLEKSSMRLENYSGGGEADSPGGGEEYSPGGEGNGGTGTPIEPSLLETTDNRNPSIVSPKSKTRSTVVDDAFRDQMRQRFGPVFGDTVQERIDEALGHKAAKKYNDLQAYVRGWLRRDAKKEGGVSDGESGTDTQEDKPNPWIAEAARIEKLREEQWADRGGPPALPTLSG